MKPEQAVLERRYDIESARLTVCEISAGKPESDVLYIFSKYNLPQFRAGVLWGVVDCVRNGEILLASYSFDLLEFGFDSPLPADYRFCRMATSFEIRDYFYNQGCFDMLEQMGEAKVCRL